MFRLFFFYEGLNMAKQKSRRRLVINKNEVLRVKKVRFGKDFPKQWRDNIFVYLLTEITLEQQSNEMQVFVVVENQDHRNGKFLKIEMENSIPLYALPDFDINIAMLLGGSSENVKDGVEIACARALTIAGSLEIFFEHDYQNNVMTIMLTNPKYFNSQANIPIETFTAEMQRIFDS